MRYLNILLLATVLSSSFVGCSARQSIPVGEVPVAEAPSHDNIKNTSYAIEQNFRQEGVSLRQQGSDYARVQRIILRLESAAGITNFNFPIFIADSTEDVNAMAVNGNTIVVYRELINRVPDDAELATVLSHEVGHILAKHHEDDSSESRESILSIGSTILGTAAAIGAAYAGLGSAGADLAGDVTSTATQVVGLGAFVRSYDRELEREADHIGLMLMAKAGYDPNAALRFWAKSEDIFGEKGGFSFLSTHPSSGDREDHLRDALPIAMQFYEQRRNKPVTANRLHKQTAPQGSIRLVSAGGMHSASAANNSSASESELYLKIEAAYISRGYDPEIARSVVQNLRSAMSKLPVETRTLSLQQVLRQLNS